MSPTRIATYLACPVKYRWTYVDARGKWYIRAKSYYSFGSSLHRVLERFHDSNDTGVTTTDEAVAALEENWIEAGYGSQEEMMQSLAEGKEILAAHVEELAKTPVTAQTLYVEKMLRKDLGSFTLIGRIDRVDEHEDGTLEIIDYKSGRQGVTEEEVKTDLAMGVYQVLLRHLHPDRNVVASIIALRTGAKATASLTEDEIAEFEGDIRALGEMILERDYANLEPVGKALCLRCDFVPLCQRHPEFSISGLAPESSESSLP